MIPYLWRDKVVFDIVTFTEEWYKGIFSLFQVLIAFIAFDYLIKRYNVKQSKKNINLIIDSLKDDLKVLSSTLEHLKSYVLGDSITWNENACANDFRIVTLHLKISIKMIQATDGFSTCKEAVKIQNIYSSSIQNSLTEIDKKIDDDLISFGNKDEEVIDMIVSLQKNIRLV